MHVHGRKKVVSSSSTRRRPFSSVDWQHASSTDILKTTSIQPILCKGGSFHSYIGDIAERDRMSRALYVGLDIRGGSCCTCPPLQMCCVYVWLIFTSLYAQTVQ